MKIAVGEMTNPQLNWAVAHLLGADMQFEMDGTIKVNGHRFDPCGDWSQGGPISEAGRIWCRWMSNDDPAKEHWEAVSGWFPKIVECSGPTELLAKMRCLVTKRLGDVVDIPDELAAFVLH